MVKKADRSFTAISDLVDCLVQYSETLKNPPEDSDIIAEKDRQAETYRFVIKSPKDRSDAIIRLLFEDEFIIKKRGNKSFYESDRDEIINMIKEMEQTGKTKEELLDKYVDLVQARSVDTQEESIRSRLKKAYSVYKKELNAGRIKYPESDLGSGFEENDKQEINILLPWLIKYKRELINLLSD